MTQSSINHRILQSTTLKQSELERTPGAVAVSLKGKGAGVFLAPILLPKVGQTHGPGGGDPPLLDYSVISGRKLSLASEPKKSFWKQEKDDKEEKTLRRIRRFYQRFFTGVAVGGRLRFLTLTSSDEAVSQDKDIHQSWTCLKKRLRRRLGVFEYIGVREIKGDRQHLHLVFRGSYIEQQLISAWWTEIHKSPVVFVEAMYRVKGGARELGKYLGKQIRNRYWCSYDWVFKGWVGWSRKVRQLRGNFPSKTILVALAKLAKDKRKELQGFLCPELDLEFG